ncbi:MAG: FMN-binding protein [Planctomycetota bacterium]|jgi:Na+-translocating ferredoxin:NAD+ oxidoreductase RnfG subunit|nr:FMN-binding protein [Planctomycetota bacterium]
MRALLLCFVLFSLAGGDSKFPTREEALSQLIPEAKWSVETVYLSKATRKRAKELAGSKVSGVVRGYQATSKEGKHLGWAIVDTHRVRAKGESLMFAVSPEGKLLGSRVLGFAEPRDYLLPAKWFKQLEGRVLDDQLHLKKGVDGVTGATLSSRAAVNATRRALALWEVTRESP